MEVQGPFPDDETPINDSRPRKGIKRGPIRAGEEPSLDKGTPVHALLVKTPHQVEEALDGGSLARPGLGVEALEPFVEARSSSSPRGSRHAWAGGFMSPSGHPWYFHVHH